jgi:ParB/RepB/Spo0J family partition protein
MPTYELIPIEHLIEPVIPAREAMDETKLTELCESVKEIGFIHPLAVIVSTSERDRAADGDKRDLPIRKKRLPVHYEIVDGHRRYKVGVMLSHKVLPCLIFDDPDNAREAIKLHTALFREDLSTAEEAAFIADLITKFDYTEEQLCRALRQKVSWVNERLALLHGNQSVFDALRERKINFAVAKQLNRVKNDADCKYFLNLVIEGGATALTVGRWVTEFMTKPSRDVVEEKPGQTAASVVQASPSGPVCFFCRKECNPYDLENVWIHPWEKKMIEAQIDRAAAPVPESVAAEGSPN